MLLTPHPAPGPRDALRSCLSVHPSLPPSLGLSAPPRLQTANREGDALAVTKVFPAPRSLPATAASSCPAPQGWRRLLVAPWRHRLMRSPLPRGAKPVGGHKQNHFGGSTGETTLHRAAAEPRLRHGVQWVPQGQAPCPSWGSKGRWKPPAPKSIRCRGHTGCQHPGTQPRGVHRGVGSPRNSPGSVLSRPRHLPLPATTTVLLPPNHRRQLLSPRQRGDAPGCRVAPTHLP